MSASPFDVTYGCLKSYITLRWNNLTQCMTKVRQTNFSLAIIIQSESTLIDSSIRDGLSWQIGAERPFALSLLHSGWSDFKCAVSPVNTVAWFKHLLWLRTARCTWCLYASLIKATRCSWGFGASTSSSLWSDGKLARWGGGKKEKKIRWESKYLFPTECKEGGIQSKDTSVSDTSRTLCNQSIFGHRWKQKRLGWIYSCAPQRLQKITCGPLGAGVQSSNHKCYKPSTEVRVSAVHRGLSIS